MNLKMFSVKSMKVVTWLSVFLGALIISGKWVDVQNSLRVPASLGRLFVFTDLWDKGYFNAIGTWKSFGVERIDNLNSVEITCSTARKMCAVSVASINQLDDTKPLLSTSLEIFDIFRWDSQVIIFKEEKKCAVTTFSINRETKTVSAMTKHHTTVSGCALDNSKEINHTLVNGIDVYLDLMKDNKREYGLFVFVATIVLLIAGFGIYRVVKRAKVS